MCPSNWICIEVLLEAKEKERESEVNVHSWEPIYPWETLRRDERIKLSRSFHLSSPHMQARNDAAHITSDITEKALFRSFHLYLTVDSSLGTIQPEHDILNELDVYLNLRINSAPSSTRLSPNEYNIFRRSFPNILSVIPHICHKKLPTKTHHALPWNTPWNRPVKQLRWCGRHLWTSSILMTVTYEHIVGNYLSSKYPMLYTWHPMIFRNNSDSLIFILFFCTGISKKLPDCCFSFF